MGNSNIGTLILYKQHYRDNYNNEASLPENQLFSTFGYYDGFKIIQEESNNSDVVTDIYIFSFFKR